MASLPDYFALYGIKPTFQPDVAAVRKQYYALSMLHHPDRAGGDITALQKASEVNEGYRILQDADVLMGYVLKLEGVVADDEQYKLAPAFLMEMMELNETISAALASRGMLPEAKQAISAAMAEWDSAAALETQRYSRGERSPELFAKLKDFYYRKKYLLRVKRRLD